MLAWDLYGGLKDVTRKVILGSWGDKSDKANVTGTSSFIEHFNLKRSRRGGCPICLCVTSTGD